MNFNCAKFYYVKKKKSLKQTAVFLSKKGAQITWYRCYLPEELVALADAWPAAALQLTAVRNKDLFAGLSTL